MPSVALTRKQGQMVTKLMLICFGVLMCVIVYVLNGQHDGCERSKLDRGANAQGWRTAQTARLKTVAEAEHISYIEAEQLMLNGPKPGDSPDLVAARRYNVIATGLERRSRVDCPGDFLPGEIL